MPAKKDIIDAIVPTPRSQELVRLIIPILIRWAKSGKTDMTYGDLNMAVVGRRQYRLGHQLGQVHKVIDELQSRSGIEIPTLNTLVKNQKGFPSPGFVVVYPHYNKLNDEEKRVFVEGMDSKAIKFKRWDWVLNQLGLKPAQLTTEEELQAKTGKMGGGGESSSHKRLKKFILDHPESIGLKDVVFSSDEYTLPSGDRIDVYFIRKNGDRVAVEIKPKSSSDEDMMRGIFQCVKYDAVMDAVGAIECGSFNVSSILVLGGSLSDQNWEIATELGVDFREDFKMKL